MENNKNHIDNFLKDKMQDMHFELNEEHWQDAERRLDEEDDRKKPFFLLFLVGVLLIGLGTAAYKQISSSKKSRVVNRNEAKTDASASEAEQFVHTNYSNEDDKAETETMDQSMVSGSSSPSETKSNNSNSNNEVNNTSTSSYLVEPQIAKAPKKSAAQRTTAAPKQTIAKKTGLDNKKNSSVKAPTKKVVASKNDNKKNSKAKTKGGNKSIAKAVDQKANDNLGSPESQTVAQVNTSAKSNNVSQQSKIIADANSSKPNIRIYKSAADYQKLNPRYVDGLENYEYTISNIDLTIKQSDSIRALLAKQDKPAAAAPVKSKPKQDFFQQPSNFFILAGIAAARGYRGNSDVKPAYGLSPSLGVGYQYNFSERMSVYTSIFMSYISHLNIRESSKQVTYGFDKDSTILSVTRKNLLQLHLPVQLAYKLHPKHSLFGGLGVNLGMNTISLYEDSKQSSASKQFGYTSGLRFMDFNASLGYEYLVSPQLSLGVFYQQGFMDMTKNDYFNNKQTDRNSRGGINLRYKFKK